MHGVTHTIEQIRERGVPGFEVEVVGTDAGVDRRLPAAAELEVPFYEGMRLGVPGLPGPGRDPRRGPLRPRPRHRARARPASPRRCSAGSPAMPLLASYHTELGRLRRPAQRRRRPRGDGADGARRLLRRARRWSSRRAPRPTRSLLGLGVDPARIGRWERGVDVARFDPAKADRDAFPGEIKVLYAGRLTREKGVDLLAESFLRAHAADPRLHLLLAGGGPEEEELRARLGERATFLGWLERRGAGPRLRQRRRLPLLLAAPTPTAR